MRVFVAGATGAVGRRLVPALVAGGHGVTATTRSPAKLAGLAAAGARPALLDGLDAVAVGQAVARAEPEVIVHEMTAIPATISLRRFDRSLAPTNALRTQRIDHLLAAADAAGVRRVVAQSYAGWPSIRGGGPVHAEERPAPAAEPLQAGRQTLAALRYLERAVLSAPLEGLVLRYASLYGPGASDGLVAAIARRRFPVVGDGTGIWSFLHVADAAAATAAAVERGAPGIYNVADDEPAALVCWLPEVAEIIGAPPPRHVPGWLGTILAGRGAVAMASEVRGVFNDKAKRELGWVPAWASWRDGFARGLADGDSAAARPARERGEVRT